MPESKQPITIEDFVKFINELREGMEMRQTQQQPQPQQKGGGGPGMGFDIMSLFGGAGGADPISGIGESGVGINSPGGYSGGGGPGAGMGIGIFLTTLLSAIMQGKNVPDVPGSFS